MAIPVWTQPLYKQGHAIQSLAQCLALITTGPLGVLAPRLAVLALRPLPEACLLALVVLAAP